MFLASFVARLDKVCVPDPLVAHLGKVGVYDQLVARLGKVGVQDQLVARLDKVGVPKPASCPPWQGRRSRLARRDLRTELCIGVG